jgi:hypothetical protein
VHWPATTRLGLALIEAGFSVAAVAVAEHGLRRLRRLDASFVFRPYARLAPLVRRAIETWSPDIVIPGDDPSLHALHELHGRATAGEGREPARMLQLIERSLGDAASFRLVDTRSEFIELAKSEGLRVPGTAVIRDIADLRRHLAGASFPKVLKVDRSWGGQGVRIVHSVEDAEGAFVALTTPPRWGRIAKCIVQDLDLTPLRQRQIVEPPIVTLQDYIIGRPANRAVVCWQGEVLAGLSVEVLQNDVETGPSTVVRVVDNLEMEHAAARIARRLNLSGFCGFDFMRDEAGGMHLLELNGRSTQICHLALSEAADMPGALHAQLTGTPRRRIAASPHEVIAFFPQEYWRDPASDYLGSAFHDVPWQAPELIAMYLQAPRRGWLDELLRALRGFGAHASALGAVQMTRPAADKGRG